MSDDPSVYLRASKTSQMVDQTRMFDSKKWVWVPDEDEGFKAASITSQKGDKCVLELSDGQEIEMDISNTQQMNPPKFEKIEDMAGLTYLNEASVLHNLRQRYYSNLIYTYSGLFCVAVNPYRMLPIYSPKVVDMYRGKRKTEMPPHVFSITDNAYRDMLQDRENQSILITGESGAGKTENTKKVIQYMAYVAPAAHKTSTANLEDQVIQANPVLEAFGNAKTIRNDNSSRFGKFIRVHFGPQGKIAGADIEYYLLEKSRVIQQQPGERCYHIFYQILAGADDKLLGDLLLSRQVKSYSFLANGEVSVDNVNDSEELKFTTDAMDVLGMEKEEQVALFRTVAGILHFGNIEVKQRPREEWATIPTATDAEKVAHLLGINSTDLIKALIKPRIKVGNEYVQQGRNLEQVKYSIGALSKALYERMFTWLVKRINKTLDTKARKNFFIGVLDIAGFEIFVVNSFEQLCINFTNEKLQQFFNHHMFVLEQEEYRKENIKWEFIDFGLDLQPTIDLIEKPMGILALLDEECLFPKASDKSYVEKLHKNHDGKTASYVKPSFKSRGSQVDFELTHYAGTVGYTVIGWLDKNKDPLNDSVIELFKKSSDPFIVTLWSDYLTEGERPRGKKGASFITMGQNHKTSLNNLMTTLRNTTPNFVRCIIPNELKKAGLIDAVLVLHQLRCNGVLEGIRICRKGFPNRLLYQEFRQRYVILAPKAIPAGFMDGRKAAELLLEALQLESSEYRLGNSKVFFRAGVLGRLEDMRDERLGIVLTQFQAFARGYLMRKQYRKLIDQRLAVAVLQRNIRKYLFLRDWKWWKLYTKVKPLLNVARTEDELRQKEEELNKLREKVIKEETMRKELEDGQTALMEEKNQLYLQLQREQETATEAEENVQRLVAKKGELELQFQEMVDRLDEEIENNENISAARRKLEAELDSMRENVDDLTMQLESMEQEKNQKEKDAMGLDAELEKINDALAKANKDKKHLDERLAELTNSLQSEEDKANRLSKTKIKLESAVHEAHDDLEKEKAHRSEVEKVKRKLEGDLKATQESVDNLTANKQDLERHVASKDKEIAGLQQKVEEDASEVATLQKKIRELEAKISELEEELDSERSARARVEKQKNELLRELESLNDKLEEEGGVKTAQIEISRKREAELNQLRGDMDAQSEEHEKAIADLKKKHTNAISELEEQMETLQKSKSKLEKDVHRLNAESGDLGGQVEDLHKSKANTEKKLRQVEEQLNESNSKVAEYEATIASLTSSQSKLQAETSDLSSQLSDAESKVGTLSKAKNALESQVEDLKTELESETSAKHEAQSKLKIAHGEIEQLKESIDEEQEGSGALQKQLTAAKTEANSWKTKYEGEAAPKIEELEEAKRKLTIKLKEAEEALSGVEAKYSSLEKTKKRIADELEDLNIELDKERNTAAALEKKQKQIDKQITEWKTRYDEKEAELANSQREAHASSTELLKLKNLYEELEEKVEGATKDNKRLQGEIDDLEKQLNEGGLSAHEMEKAKKRVEQEKEELAQTLEEIEAQLDHESGQLVSYQLEITKLKQEMDRRINEKDEEQESLRKNHQRQMASLQQSVEEETRLKNEQVKQKKLMEAQVNELNDAVDDQTKAATDMAKKNKSLQAQLKELTGLYEEEQRSRDEQHELLTRAEKKSSDLSLEVEELKASVEQLQRSLRTSNTEKTEAQDRVSELSTSNSSLQAAKRKAEQQVASLQEENEELESEAKEKGEKLQKVTDQNNRTQSELMAAKERLSSLEKAKSSLDQQVKDLNSRLEEEVANATKSAKREAVKLQAKILELEGELDAETKGKNDAQRLVKKTNTKVKEAQAQLEEERSNGQRLQGQITQLNSKLKNLRRDKEDAEGEVETLQKKNRQLRSQLDESEETNSDLQTQMAKMRSAARRPTKTAVVESDEEK